MEVIAPQFPTRDLSFPPSQPTRFGGLPQDLVSGGGHRTSSGSSDYSGDRPVLSLPVKLDPGSLVAGNYFLRRCSFSIGLAVRTSHARGCLREISTELGRFDPRIQPYLELDTLGFLSLMNHYVSHFWLKTGLVFCHLHMKGSD